MKYLLMVAVVIGGLFMFMQNSRAENLLSYAQLQAKITAQEDFVLLDVRTLDEYNSGHIPTAVLLPHDEINSKAEALVSDKNKEIVVYCRSGRRSAIAAEALVKVGYTNVQDFGGISRWQGALEK